MKKMNFTRGQAGFMAGFAGMMLAGASMRVFHWPESIFVPFFIGIFLSLVVAFWPQSKHEPE